MVGINGQARDKEVVDREGKRDGKGEEGQAGRVNFRDTRRRRGDQPTLKLT